MKKFNKKNFVVVNVAKYIVGIIFVVIDLCFFEHSQSLNNLVEIMFSSILVLAGIWVSCYLLCIELYKDRYQFNVIKKEFLPIMKDKLIDVICLVVFGIIILLLGHSLFSSMYYIVLSTISIIRIFKIAYDASKSLMINTYVDKFMDDIEKDLKERDAIEETVVLTKIKNIFDESIIKGEYFVAQNICEKTGKIFRSFLKNSIGKEKAEENFNEIVNLNIYELQMCEKIDSSSLRLKVVRQQYENLIFCIENYQTEWYKKYLDKYNRYIFHLQKDTENNLNDYIEQLYCVHRLLIDEFIDKDYSENLKYTFEEIESITKSLIFVNKNTNIQNYINLLTHTISSYKNKDIPSYDTVYHKFIVFSKYVLETRNVFDDIKVFYAVLFNDIKKNDLEHAIKFYEDIFEDTIPASYNSSYIEFKQYCIKELLASISKEDSEKRGKIFKYHVNSLFEIIDMDIKYNGFFFLPDFQEEILSNQYNTERIKDILSDIKSLINRSIIKDNVSALFHLLNSINKVLEKTNKKDREIQMALFDIYIWLISRTRSVVNKQFFEVSFDMLERAIDMLDRNRSISDKFGDYIIDSLAGKARHVNKETQKTLDAVIGLFFSFLEEDEAKNFAISSVDKKKKIYRSIFNIGVDCIENNYEEGLRRVSNTIGWFTIYSIRQTTNGLTMYLIDRAIDLYNISEKMDISSKTLAFIRTLFTTVGMYCCKEKKNRGFLYRIYDAFKEDDFEKLEIAVSIRTSENDTWNDLFDGRTNELRKTFLTEFKNSKVASRGEQ